MRRHLFFAVLSVLVAISIPCLADDKTYTAGDATAQPPADPSPTDTAGSDSGDPDVSIEDDPGKEETPPSEE